MDITTTAGSKGEITVPKAVRDALGIHEGDGALFRLDGNHAVLTRIPNLLSLAASIKVPADKRNATWDAVLHKTRARRASAQRFIEPPSR